MGGVESLILSIFTFVIFLDFVGKYRKCHEWSFLVRGVGGLLMSLGCISYVVWEHELISYVGKIFGASVYLYGLLLDVFKDMSKSYKRIAGALVSFFLLGIGVILSVIYYLTLFTFLPIPVGLAGLAYFIFYYRSELGR